MSASPKHVDAPALTDGLSEGRNNHLIEWGFLVFSITLGGVQAWVGRYSMNPDGVSYLDIGDSYLVGHWRAAVNGYWSPSYSVLLGTGLRLLRPSIRWEFPVVHMINFLVFLTALFLFRFFLHSLLDWGADNRNTSSEQLVPLPHAVLVGIGYTVFLWSSLVLIDVSVVTPDLLVAGLMFLLSGLLVELRLRNSFWHFAGFGVVCGIAYLTKGVMFPLGFLFLTVLLLSGRWSRTHLLGVLFSAVLFLLVSSPFVIALSKLKGRATYGDTGRLAYARLVSPGAPETNWQGEPAGSGIPQHPTRKLLDEPPVFEFAEPVSGTYPPWYDPSYWNEGLQWHFRLRSQLRVLSESALAYGRVLEGCSGVLVGVLAFLLVGRKPGLRAVTQNWPLWVISGAPVAIYSLVLVKTRYIAGFVAILWIAILTGIRLPRESPLRSVSRSVGIAVVVAMLVSLASSLADTSYRTVSVGTGPSMVEQIRAAEGLRALGFRTNDRVAVLGDGVNDYWARLGRFKIVSQIECPDPERRQFWAASSARKQLVYQSIGRTRAKAIIAWNPPTSDLSGEWTRVSGTNFFAYFLAKPGTSGQSRP